MKSERESRRELRRLQKSLAAVTAAADALSASLEAIRQQEGRRLEEQLARSLSANRTLQGLFEVQSALGTTAAPGDLVDCQNVFVGLRNWIADHLNVEMVSEVGATPEIPVAQLDKFEIRPDAAAPGAGLVRVEVLSPGVKWRGQVIARPIARIA